MDKAKEKSKLYVSFDYILTRDEEIDEEFITHVPNGVMNSEVGFIVDLSNLTSVEDTVTKVNDDLSIKSTIITLNDGNLVFANVTVSLEEFKIIIENYFKLLNSNHSGIVSSKELIEFKQEIV